MNETAKNNWRYCEICDRQMDYEEQSKCTELDKQRGLSPYGEDGVICFECMTILFERQSDGPMIIDNTPINKIGICQRCGRYFWYIRKKQKYCHRRCKGRQVEPSKDVQIRAFLNKECWICENCGKTNLECKSMYLLQEPKWAGGSTKSPRFWIVCGSRKCRSKGGIKFWHKGKCLIPWVNVPRYYLKGPVMERGQSFCRVDWKRKREELKNSGRYYGQLIRRPRSGWDDI